MSATCSYLISSCSGFIDAIPSFIFLKNLTILNFLSGCSIISRSSRMDSPMRDISKDIFFLYVVKFILEIVIFSTFFWQCLGYGGCPKGWFLSCICPSALTPNSRLYYRLGLGFLHVMNSKSLAHIPCRQAWGIIFIWVLFLPKAKAR